MECVTARIKGKDKILKAITVGTWAKDKEKLLDIQLPSSYRLPGAMGKLARIPAQFTYDVIISFSSDKYHLNL